MQRASLLAARIKMGTHRCSKHSNACWNWDGLTSGGPGAGRRSAYGIIRPVAEREESVVERLEQLLELGLQEMKKDVSV